MFSVQNGPLPEDSYLRDYGPKTGSYTDCFYLDVKRDVLLGDYIRAFFNTPIFRLERVILATFLGAGSSRQDVLDLASGAGTKLAAWQMEERSDDQILLAVTDGPVRTWLMVGQSPEGKGTRLYFGSAVVPMATNDQGEPEIGDVYKRFMGFHKLYSRILLKSAARKLRR